MLVHREAKRPAVTSGLCYSVTQGTCPRIGLAFRAAFSHCSLAARGLGTITPAPLWHYCFPGFFSPSGVHVSDYFPSNLHRSLVSTPRKDMSLSSSWFGNKPPISVNIFTQNKTKQNNTTPKPKTNKLCTISHAGRRKQEGTLSMILGS